MLAVLQLVVPQCKLYAVQFRVTVQRVVQARAAKNTTNQQQSTKEYLAEGKEPHYDSYNSQCIDPGGWGGY